MSQICMSELDLNDISSSRTTLVDPTGGSLFGGSINFSIQPINKINSLHFTRENVM